ncbi:epimerase [Kroppenstedtia sanguinis]|uniref:Epimerase n=1 Tax=Kroppenstedtia sanguinis TaxID=1380684 RepID=A0ABW4C699_9BACL
MEEQALDKFGKMLMEKVRDMSIGEWDDVVNGKMKAPVLVELYEELASSFDKEQLNILSNLIPQIVDTTLHYTLACLEEEKDDVKVSVQVDQGTVDDLVEASDGLAGELYTEDGWIARFSKERHYPS